MSFAVPLFALGFLTAGCGRTADLAEAQELVQQGRETIEDAAALQAQRQTDRALGEFERGQELLIRARKLFLEARADRSRDSEVLIEFAELAERLQDFDLAGEAYRRAAMLESDSPELWYRAGANFVEAGGRYSDDAIDALERARTRIETGDGTVAPEQVSARLGKLYWHEGLIDVAELKYFEALGSSADYAPARAGLACVALVQGDPVATADMLDDLPIENEADAHEVDRMLRQAYLRFRSDRTGIPDTAAAHLALGTVAVRLGFLQEARLAIERSLSLDGSNVFAWNLAGSLARQAGDIERAREAFQRSLELEPDQERTREALTELGNPASP